MSEGTDTITIRVSKSLKEQLDKTSKKNHLTLNNLINQILYKRMQWDEQLNKMGWLQFEPTVVKQVFRYLTKDEMNDAAEKSKKGVTKAIVFIYGDNNVDHVAEFIDSWLTVTNMAFRHIEEQNFHKFIVNHDLGRNWSYFANQVTKGFCEEAGHKITDREENEDSYSFVIQK